MIKKIYKPFTPSTILEDEVKEVIINVIDTIDGNTYYTRDEFNLEAKFIQVETNLNKKVNINTNHIIKTTQAKLIKVPVVNLGHTNYGANGDIINYYYLAHELAEIEIVQAFGDSPRPLTMKNPIL